MEEEFQKLVQGMYQEIQNKRTNGELTAAEAEELRQMVASRLVIVEEDDNSWCASNGSPSYDYNDDGWYSSSC